MKDIRITILCVLLVILGLFLLYEGWYVVLHFFGLLTRYKWVGLGIAAYCVFHYLLKRYKRQTDTFNENLTFMQVFSHELTHAIVAILCMRKITSFHVEKKGGVVWMTGGKWTEGIITLSPYCLPVFTVIMLLLWSMVATRSLVTNEGLQPFDIIIGITIAFHAFCFWNQTGTYQSDIRQFPLFFSYSFIWLMRILNLLIILLCYMPSFKTGQPLKLWGAIWYLTVHVWNDIIGVF